MATDPYRGEAIVLLRPGDSPLDALDRVLDWWAAQEVLLVDSAEPAMYQAWHHDFPKIREAIWATIAAEVDQRTKRLRESR